jgi:L-Lysine epsilon oxidase N-terminal/L-lysine epsilon oxidase C-terminal domain
MTTGYKIHPGIGIARLGNAPESFCISPEAPAALPIDCDARGNPLLSPDGRSEQTIRKFKDGEGRIKRQAARFQVYVYDDESPEGRPLRMGDPVSGGGNQGFLIDIQWRAYLANKKSSWYEFMQLAGEHGYAPDHPRRNADIADPGARQRLIIDPGPRIVDCTRTRGARFDRDGGDVYATTFPPPLKPCPIDTLGEIMTDDSGRLLVLGGHGHSGSFLADQFGQPRIDTYANNDGWFDDTSDGPVTARLVMYSPNVGAVRYVDVEYPAWVLVGYPAYVPQILDMVTLEEVMEDLAVQQFASRPELFGPAGGFDDPQHVDPTDTEALILWRAGRLRWNPAYRPWFYRDIWPILFRADQFSYLTNVLGLSNYPHNQSARGNFDPFRLGVPPQVDAEALKRCQRECLARQQSGRLFVETLEPALQLLDRQEHARQLRGAAGAGAGTAGTPDALPPVAGAAAGAGAGVAGGPPRAAAGEDRIGRFTAAVRKALATFAAAVLGGKPDADPRRYLADWRQASQGSPEAKEQLDQAIEAALAEVESTAGPDAGGDWRELRPAVAQHLKRFHSGKLLEDALAECVAACTQDPYRDYRQFLFDLLRQPGEENNFRVGGKPSSRVHGLPLMPLLAGDNPISNHLPAKFLALTDYQYYLLRQWARGLFFNEEMEGWGPVDPWRPYAGWQNRTGRDLDRGVLTNLLGGAFCPGGEVGWIIRNTAIYLEPYRVKADPGFSSFRQTAAQANANRGAVPEADYSAYVDSALSQSDNFDRGMQPGDLTKHMAVPWQADFNECTTQTINITYEGWNLIYPESEKNTLMRREQAVWETLWWPAHRPLQVFETNADGDTPFVDWSRGVPQTAAGNLKMVTEWRRLPFVRVNPAATDLPSEVPPPSPPPYIAVERTPEPRPGQSPKK